MNRDEYQTSNIYIASYIFAKNNPNIKFLGLAPGQNERQRLFVFTPKIEAEILEAEFYSNEPTPIKTYIAELQNTRDLLFSKEVK